MSKAAKEMGVQQSTVSRRLSALEESLNVKLFERTPEGLKPTPLAQRWLAQAHEMERHAIDLTTLAEGQAEQPRGLVRIALTEVLATYVIVPELSRWQTLYPDIQIELQTSYYNADLPRREADIALRFAQPTQGDLTIKRLATMSMGLYAHKAYITHSRRVDALEQLDWVMFALHDGPSPERDWINKHIGQITPVLTTNSYIAQVEALRQGLGVGLITDAMAAAIPELAPYPFEQADFPEIELWLVTPRLLRHVPRIDVIWTLLESLFDDF